MNWKVVLRTDYAEDTLPEARQTPWLHVSSRLPLSQVIVSSGSPSMANQGLKKFHPSGQVLRVQRQQTQKLVGTPFGK